MKITINQYLKFALNIVFLIFLAMVADQLIGRIIRYYYFEQKSGQQFRTTYAMNSANSDILVFGSSRATHHYVPEIFEDSLNMSMYNSGREGSLLLYSYAVFKATVKRHTPKIVIFDVIPADLCYDESSIDRLSSLLPYYRTHPEIREIVELKGPLEKYKLISEIYPFNSSLLSIIMGNLKRDDLSGEDQKGYIPLYGRISDSVVSDLKLDESTIDTVKVRMLQEVIDYCDANNIRLLVIQSPYFADILDSNSENLLEQITQDNKVPYLNYTNRTEFLTCPELFWDQGHLNDQGARFYSSLIAHQIARFINESVDQHSETAEITRNMRAENNAATAYSGN